MAAIKDINIRVKYTATRALFHLLDGGSASAIQAFESGAASAGEYLHMHLSVFRACIN